MQIVTDGGETEGKERRRGGTREKWDKWVDGNDGEVESVCDIPGDECGNQEWMQGDKNCDEGSLARCGKRCQPSGMKIWSTKEKMNLGKG
jgi:hypothetical protein